MNACNLLKIKEVLLSTDIFSTRFRSAISVNTNRLQLRRKQQGINVTQASYCSSSSTIQRLIVNAYGDPKEVVVKECCPLPTFQKANQVLVRVLASLVNPADINTIQGVYAVKPDFPFVPGNEAVMEVVDVASDVESLSPGDKVIPALHAMGTWRSMAVVLEEELIKIPPDIDMVTAATIGANPCTAYRMLHDFVALRKGDVVIQNCANSAVGQAVIQLAASRGIQTINIVRNRPDLDSLKSYLKELGATMTVTEEELRASKVIKNLPKPALAFNGVSGRPATDMLRQLDNGGTMVTYGGMSKQPVTVPVGSLIFNDLVLRGFWMTRWNQIHKKDAHRISMLEDLFNLVRDGKFKPPPHTLVPIENYQTALENAMPADGKIGRKQILTFH